MGMILSGTDFRPSCSTASVALNEAVSVTELPAHTPRPKLPSAALVWWYRMRGGPPPPIEPPPLTNVPSLLLTGARRWSWLRRGGLRGRARRALRVGCVLVRLVAIAPRCFATLRSRERLHSRRRLAASTSSGAPGTPAPPPRRFRPSSSLDRSCSTRAGRSRLARATSFSSTPRSRRRLGAQSCYSSMDGEEDDGEDDGCHRPREQEVAQSYSMT